MTEKRTSKKRYLHEWLELQNVYATKKQLKAAEEVAKQSNYTPKHAIEKDLEQQGLER